MKVRVTLLVQKDYDIAVGGYEGAEADLAKMQEQFEERLAKNPGGFIAESDVALINLTQLDKGEGG